MSFKQISELRKSGKLQEALMLAESELADNPDDIWNKRAIVWVYYEYLKIALSKKNVGDFVKQMENIKKLDLDSSEKMVFDSMAWSIGKLLFAIDDSGETTLDNIFALIKDFHFTKPSDSYSFMLKAFKKHALRWKDFSEFVDWWDMDNFQEKDYENYVSDTGKRFPSLVESVYIAISKSLLSKPIESETIKEFLPRIKSVCDKYPKMQYPPYYFAKLLIAIGDKEHFMEAFLPFARKKQRDFWVWDLMSEMFDRNSKEYFSCLCKSLLCGAPDKFTGNVREKIAGVFMANKKYAEAKFELLNIIETRKAEGWALRNQHIEWLNYPWWDSTKATTDNRHIYEANIAISQGLLYGNEAEELIVMERVNKAKTVLNFVASKQKYGMIYYGNFSVSPNVGEVYAVRFAKSNKAQKSSFYKVNTMVLSNHNPSKETYKEVEGALQIKKGNSFGFVNGVFVPPNVLKEKNLINGRKVKAAAVISFNAKNKVWGWKAISVELIDE